MRLPLAEGLGTSEDLPHTISEAILYRLRVDSFNELPKDKRPPRDLWTKPHKLEEFLDTVFDIKGSAQKRNSYVDLDLEDVE